MILDHLFGAGDYCIASVFVCHAMFGTLPPCVLPILPGDRQIAGLACPYSVRLIDGACLLDKEL